MVYTRYTNYTYAQKSLQERYTAAFVAFTADLQQH